MAKITIKIGDITQENVDVIVNAANNSLLGGGGVDGAIHRAAGFDLYKECQSLQGCDTGEAKITKGYNLPASHVIHTVGPYFEGTGAEAKLLKSCYLNSLKLAHQYNLKRIAFPAISTGVFNYPKEEAAQIALDTVKEYLSEFPGVFDEVVFVLFSELDHKIYTLIDAGINNLEISQLTE